MDRKHEHPELEAAQWFARLQEPELSEQQLLAWEQWISSSAENMRAFSHYQTVYRRLDQLGAMPLPDKKEITDDDYDGSVSINEWLAGQQKTVVANVSTHPAAKRKAWWVSIAAAATIILTVSVALLVPKSGVVPQVQVYETAVAEHRVIELSDGSEIVLGGKSSVLVSYTNQQRSIALSRGEALFTVAKDNSRPFIVLAGNGSATALGTVFNVHRYTDRTQITVTEGRVQVASRVTGKVESVSERESSAILGRGQRINYTSDGELTAVASVDPVMATAWRQGYWRYRNTPLKYVVDDVNRYSGKKITLVGSNTDELLFTGTVYHGQIDEWVGGIVDVFGLEISEIDDRTVILRKRGAW